MTADESWLARHCRRMFLRDLSQPMHIGVHDFEQGAPQRILFNIDLWVPLEHSTPTADQLDEVVDYDFVRDVVSKAASRGHIRLQESLCDEVLDTLLAHPKVVAARVSTCKPDIYPNCAGVGVERFKSKLWT